MMSNHAFMLKEHSLLLSIEEQMRSGNLMNVQYDLLQLDRLRREEVKPDSTSNIFANLFSRKK